VLTFPINCFICGPATDFGLLATYNLAAALIENAPALLAGVKWDVALAMNAPLPPSFSLFS